MLARLYEAHYLKGRRIADQAVLIELAREVGLDRAAFSEALSTLRKAGLSAHFADSREFLSKTGGRGFPTFVLERNGTLERLDHTQFLGRPESWQNALQSLSVSTPPPTVALGAGRGPDGCAI